MKYFIIFKIGLARMLKQKLGKKGEEKLEILKWRSNWVKKREGRGGGRGM
jgi:hypothetical protein